VQHGGNIAKGKRQKAEGKRFAGKSFIIYLCPNRLGDCYNYSVQKAKNTMQTFFPSAFCLLPSAFCLLPPAFLH
jgi:hypothetical protein